MPKIDFYSDEWYRSIEYSDKWQETVPILINEYHKSLHEKKYRRCLSALHYKYIQRCVRIYEKMPTR